MGRPFPAGPFEIMYEIFCTVSDELGTRSVATGHGSFLEAVADDLAAELARSYRDQSFYVEWVPIQPHY